MFKILMTNQLSSSICFINFNHFMVAFTYNYYDLKQRKFTNNRFKEQHILKGIISSYILFKKLNFHLVFTNSQIAFVSILSHFLKVYRGNSGLQTYKYVYVLGAQRNHTYHQRASTFHCYSQDHCCQNALSLLRI